MSRQVESRADPMWWSNVMRNHEPSNKDEWKCWKGQFIAFTLMMHKTQLRKVAYKWKQ